MIPIPTSSHNEALSGDTLYSAFLNYEWRQIVMPFVISGMKQIAAGIDDESDRQDFEVLYGAMIDDFYNEDVVDGTPVGSVVWFPHDTIPEKWLKCDGTTFVSADYPALAVLLSPGTPGTNTGLPDLSNRFLFGASIDADLFDTGGADQQTLAEGNLPAHTHTTPAHTHTYTAADNTGVNTGRAARGGGTNVGTNTGIISGGGGVSGSTGSGTAFSIMPPFIRGYWIIKALP